MHVQITMRGGNPYLVQGISGVILLVNSDNNYHIKVQHNHINYSAQLLFMITFNSNATIESQHF